VHLARIGHDARLWARDAALAEEMCGRRANAVYLPDVTFPERLQVTCDLEQALREVDVVVAAVPSHGTREILRHVAAVLARPVTMVRAVKGLERDTLFRMPEVIV